MLIGLSFPTSFRAQEFLTAANGLAASGRLVLKDAVTIFASPQGKVKVHETVDPTPMRAAVTGALWGSLLGLFAAGPLGWVIGLVVGGGGGAIAAHFIDIGISDNWVAWFTEVIRPDSATLALLVDHLNADALVAEAARFPGARVISTSLDQDTDARLRAAIGQAPEPQAPVDGPPGIGADPQLGRYPHH